MQASGPIPPTKPSSYFAGDRLDLPNQSREGHSGGSKSNQGSSSTTESQRGGWEGRAPTYILNTSGSMHYLWAVVHRYTYTSLPWTIFLGHDQKNSLKCGSSSTLFFFLHVKTFDDVKGCCSCLEETCHRPPREETERLQRRGEKERRQSAVGHSLHIKATSFFFCCFFFFYPNTTHLCCNQSQSSQRGREGGRARERGSQMSAWYVSDLCSSRLAGMDYDRAHDFCLMCRSRVLARMCDQSVKRRCTCTSIHVEWTWGCCMEITHAVFR